MVRETICVVRHGHAGDSTSDPARDDARALASKGRKQAVRAGEVLAKQGLAPFSVWTSPLRRAVETAETAAKAAKAQAPRIVTEALRPDVPPGRVLAELAEASADDRAAGKGPARAVRWIVGHEPHLS